MAAALVLFSTLACAHGSGRSAEPSPAAGPQGDMRSRIDEAIEREVAPLRERDEVASYLDRLRARAETQRQVTALEVEPGVEAIARLEVALGTDATHEWIRSFTQSMAALSESYRPVPATHN